MQQDVRTLYSKNVNTILVMIDSKI